MIKTPGDCNGLIWSADGRYLLVGDDHSLINYIDSQREWKIVGTSEVGGAAKRMVADPAFPDRVLVACYDGRIWSVPAAPGGGEPRVAVDRRPGLWGINIAATANRLAVPSFFDRAYLLRRDDQGNGAEAVGPEPQPTFGCNWIAIHEPTGRIAVTHDDGRIRVRDAETGTLKDTYGPDSHSLYMGACFHPTCPLLATIDFYGEVLIYDTRTGKVVWRRDMDFGPGISVEFSRCGKYMAVGGYRWDGRVFDLGPDGLPTLETVLEAPNKGVIKNVAFTAAGRLLAASGDGALVVHQRQGDGWQVVHCLRTDPPMELSNGVTSSPDGKIAYIVSRDQTIRAFDLATGEFSDTGYAHTGSVQRCVHMSECSEVFWRPTPTICRTVMLLEPRTTDREAPPLRGSRAQGVSSHRGFTGESSSVASSTEWSRPGMRTPANSSGQRTATTRAEVLDMMNHDGTPLRITILSLSASEPSVGRQCIPTLEAALKGAGASVEVKRTFVICLLSGWTSGSFSNSPRGYINASMPKLSPATA